MCTTITDHTHSDDHTQWKLPKQQLEVSVQVAILMGTTEKRGLPCTSNPVEHFTTSRLLAEMLVEAGLVTGDGHIFSANTHDERVLAAVHEVELKTPGRVNSSKKHIKDLLRNSNTL